MQPSKHLPELPFEKTLRPGQRRVIAALPENKKLNVKLPTGYGKTRAFVAAFAKLKQAGRANRLLVIVPTDNQLRQFVEDGPRELQRMGISNPVSVCDVRYYKTEAVRQHRNNTCQVYVTTIQSLIGGRTSEIVGCLMQTGRWLVVVDEYHHYGVEKSWGKRVLELPCEFILALSATPGRPDDLEKQ